MSDEVGVDTAQSIEARHVSTVEAFSRCDNHFLGPCRSCQRAREDLLGAGYPLPGVAKGSIAVLGSVTLDAGWRPAANSAVIEVWEDGSEVLIAFVPLRGKDAEWTWAGASEKLASKRTYNVIVKVKVTDGTSVETLITAPRRTKTK